MSYKDQRKELGLELAGSLAPLDSTRDGSKWHHGVDAAGIAKLTRLSTEINKVVEETTNSVAKAQIKVGRLLNEARELIPGDLQFGQWRAANTTITNKSTANKLMNLAKQVGDGRITQDLIDALPMSTLKELISAPDNVLSYVRDTLKDGGTVTGAEIREAKKGDQPPIEGELLDPMEDDAPDSSSKAKPTLASRSDPKPTAPTTPKQAGANASDVRNIVEGLLLEPFHVRVKALDPKVGVPYPGCKPVEWAFLLLGLDPDPAVWPAEDTLTVIVDATDVAGNDDHRALLDKAHAIIEENR